MTESQGSNWCYLPYPALYNIFQHLSYKDLVSAGQVCKLWYEASINDSLWKRLFFDNFFIDKTIPVVAGRTWYAEFKRLFYNIPVVYTEILLKHSDQVLHVSFSHDGKFFATCSKDGYVILWTSKYPAEVKSTKNMKNFKWKYTQYSQFNESDTLILVSGVHFGTIHSTSGEIAVFSVDRFELQCRVMNKPYDIFGTWYSDQSLLSGDLYWLDHLVSTSYLWLNKASQEVESEMVPITHCLFRFYNSNASSIRDIMIANCLSNSEDVDSNIDESHLRLKQGNSSLHGNPVSHNDILWVPCEVKREMCNATLEMRKDFPNPICYNSDYRKVESQSEDNSDEEAIQENNSEDDCSQSSESEKDRDVKNDKYLIFTTGYKTYTPHQIGFKRIKPFVFPKTMDLGPSLKERLILFRQSPPRDPDWLNLEQVADKFDKADHLIDLHGHIVGMGLSPDHRYLYVNSRSWPENYVISNPLDPPPIAQEIDIHVIDLVTLKQVGTMLRAHKAFTPNNECFFIFLDVCNEYVASGAEDGHGYLWDRHYGMCLAKFPHVDVVNSVAFNPRDPEMLVTTSDDHTIKIWRSRAKVNSLGLNEVQFQKGIELRKGKSSGKSRRVRYLYVNSRSWPENYVISNPLDPPPIAQEIDIHVIDLVTLKQVGTMLRAHKAFTPNNECFFIFLDVCNEYVASGAEDGHGYLWDRHYGMCLAKFPHVDVVNSVAFNPRDPEMLVTTSDDHTIKIWRSRAKVNSLGLNEVQFQKGIELRKGKSSGKSRRVR